VSTNAPSQVKDAPDMLAKLRRRMAGRVKRRTVGLTILALAAVFSCPSGRARAADSDQPAIGAAGGSEALWLWRRDVDPARNDAGLLRFAYRLSEGLGAQRYWTGPVVVGEVRHAVATGRGLHVFFADGSHRHFVPDPRLVHSEPPFQSLLDVRVPLNRPPIAACWDAQSKTLYALLTTGQAAEILAASVPDALDELESEAESEEEADAKSAEAKRPAAMKIDTLSCVVRLEGRRWIIDRAGPAEWDGSTVTVGMVARDDVIHLLYADDHASEAYRHRRSKPGGDEWTEAPTLTLASKSRPMTAGWVDDRLTVVIQEEAPKGVTLATARLEEDAWIAGPSLAENAAEPERFAPPIAPALAQSELAVSYLSGPSDYFVARWSIENGGSVDGPAIVTPLSPARTPSVGPNAQHLLQYALVLALITAYYLWRQGRIAVLLPLAEDQQYARLSNRGLGLVLDLIITAPLWGSLLYAIATSGEDAATLAEQLLLPADARPAIWFWGSAVVGVVFAVYGTCSEYAIGATPGKRIAGCRVVVEHGRRGGFKAMLIRNAVRPIEFHLPAIMLMVFLTPSRQRLGDVLAATAVVERRHDVDAAADKPEDTESDIGDDAL